MGMWVPGLRSGPSNGRRSDDAYPLIGLAVQVGWLPILLTILLALGLSSLSAAQDETPDVFTMDLEDLIALKVVSASLYEQTMTEAPSNITVVTADMIRRRGYRNLVEVCQDIPGFDFATFEDGGGEYPVHNFNRGIGGDNGNAKILIMVDGIEQNHVAFNWSMGWHNQQFLHDVERIEFIQGPGSAVYGANAYSGIIHLITKKRFEGLFVRLWAGEYENRGLDVHYGTTIAGMNLSLALRKYDSDGDGGLDRHDPAGYFHGNTAPLNLSQVYDDDGNYLVDVANPAAGQPIPDGFKTDEDDLGLRLKVEAGNAEFGLFYWDRKDGLGSYLPGYEYYMNDPSLPFQVHHRGYHLYGSHRLDLADGLALASTMVFRSSQQASDTAFTYTYRFPGMPKSYHSRSSQWYAETQLDYEVDEHHRIIAGARFMVSAKMPQLVSLNRFQDTHSSTTDSSFAIAADGGGLYQSETATVLSTDEVAGFAIWSAEWNPRLSSSIGLRYDNSSEYGSTTNPRIALIVRPTGSWHVKLMYGSAFRQPSVFELTDEFRHNPGLKPEQIATYEIENGVRVTNTVNLRINLFYSKLSDLITVVPDPSRPAGERYDNVGRTWIRGATAVVDFQPTSDFYLFANYTFTDGKEPGGTGWQAIDHVARHKVNLGLNWQPLDNHLEVNFRVNHVGEIRAPESNTWMQEHEAGFAPGYTLANLSVTVNRWLARFHLVPQLVVKNLFDEDYYGLGRQSGSSNIADYDPDTNPNPAGFIPPYHPQPGRTFLVNLTYTWAE